MKKEKFDKFFKPYSQNVDNANNLGFWKLSDALIEQIIKENIPNNIDKNQVILDAGGGTGRWVCNLSKIYKSKFIVYDLSKDMLKKAKENITRNKLEKRVELIEGDLKNMKKIKSESVDYIISVYSPISFVYEREKAFQELYRVLKKDGKIIMMGHGFYNAITSKLNSGCSERDLKNLEENKMVKWAEHVPELNVFSKEIFEKDLTLAGFTPLNVYGVPVFVQPGLEDFDPENKKKSNISLKLEDASFFQSVFDLEMKYNSDPYIVNRGVNLFIVAKK